MFNARVPEKVIQERTGHLLLVGLRAYERPSVEQHIAASRVAAAKHDIPIQAALSTNVTKASAPAPGHFAFSNSTVNNIGDK